MGAERFEAGDVEPGQGAAGGGEGGGFAPEAGEGVGGGAGPVAGHGGQQGVDEGAHRRRHTRREAAEGHRRPKRPHRQHGLSRPIAVGVLPGQGLVEHHPESVQVGAGRDGAAVYLFGREVRGRAQNLSGAGEAVFQVVPGDAEIEHRGPPVGGHQHIAGLEVAVHHPRGVNAREGLQQGHHRGGQLAPHRTPCGEGLSGYEVHREEGERAVLALIAQGHHARNPQPSQEGNLPPRPRPLLRRHRREKLHGDVLPEHGVSGAPHLAVPARIEGRDELIPLRQHRARAQRGLGRYARRRGREAGGFVVPFHAPQPKALARGVNTARRSSMN